MRNSLKTLTLVGGVVLMLLLAGCIERVEENDNGATDDQAPTPAPTEPVDPGVTPEPTPESTPEPISESTPETTPEATPELSPESTPEPAETPDTGSPAAWWELLVTDKTFPEDQIGEQVLELAEDEETFDELWEWFQLPGKDLPEIDWGTQIVLFTGTGESGSCPIVISGIEFDEDERLIAIGTERDVPSDTMCTMDWTPRVFVLAFDADHFGEGELRAMFYDDEFDQEIDPESSTVIRED